MNQDNRSTLIKAGRTAAVAFLLTIVTTAIYIYLTSPGDLGPPEHKPVPSPENLSTVTELIRSDQPPLAQWEVSIPWKDIDNFHHHLEIGANQQGWFAYRQHREEPGSAAVIIIPAAELHMLDALEADPIAWATARSSSPVRPKPPSNLNLVKAGLNINPDGHLAFTIWVVAATMSTLATIFFLFLAVNHCEKAWNQWRRAKPDPG